jgi:hypothetical protein
MKNENNESKKLLWGLLIGGAVGAGVLYYLQNSHNRETPVLKKIGKTVSEIGEMLENCNLNSTADVIENIEEKIPSKGEVFNNLADWVDSGLSIWKKFNKG